VYREFFYSGLPATERAALHQQVAAALERQNPEAHLAAIAFHLLEAGPLGKPGQAAVYALRAGDQASARLGYAQAVRHYEDALRALDIAADDPRERCDLWLRLGDARFRAGDGEASKAAFRQAAELAHAIGDGKQLARAALGIAGPLGLPGGVARDDVIDHLEGALGLLGEGADALRAIALARLSIELHISEFERSASLSNEAVAVARHAGSAEAVAEALLARHLALQRPRGPETLGERIDVAREVVRLARKSRDAELEIRGRFQLVNDLAQAGDRSAIDREVAAVARLADRLRQPFYLGFVAAWRAMLALVDGRLADAEQLIDDAFAAGSAVHGHDEVQMYATGVYQVQLYMLRFEQGHGLADVEPSWRMLAESVPIPVVRCFLVRLHCAVERWSDARDGFERFADSQFATLPEDGYRVYCMAFLADACAELGDAARASFLHESLLPYAAEHVSNGSYYYGSISYRLGRLAATIGDVQAAKTHFVAALQHHRRMGARCWLTRTQVHYAGMLLRTADPTDRGQAQDLLREGLERARHLGMVGLVAEAERLIATATPQLGVDPVSVPDPESEERAMFRRDGDLWHITYAGASCELREARGLQYIAQLLRHPGRQFHATELVQVAGGIDPSGSDAAGLADQQIVADLGNAGPLLDGPATTAYRERLTELREELAEVTGFNDLGRAARTRAEIDALTTELVNAARGHKAASHGERARLTVTKGIKTALDRLRRAHPALAAHLTATIKRGYFCVYAPDPRHPISWQC